MGKKIADNANKFWEFLYDMHLYEKKGEGLFKAFLISFSWAGGVHLADLPDTLSVSIAASLFLFSIALIMEYAVRLVSTDKIAAKIFPVAILIMSIIVTIVSFGTLALRPFKIGLNILYQGTIVPQFVIWFDVITYLLLGKPKTRKEPIENNLKEMEVN